MARKAMYGGRGAASRDAKPEPERPTRWIQGAHLKAGAFTAQARAAGQGVQEYAREKAHAPGKTGKRARLALTFGKMAKRKG
jgi:hypothetical protein